MCKGVLLMCMSVCQVYVVPLKVKRGLYISWNKLLIVVTTMWILGTELSSSTREVSAFNH